jgi:hypothetical protein
MIDRNTFLKILLIRKSFLLSLIIMDFMIGSFGIKNATLKRIVLPILISRTRPCVSMLAVSFICLVIKSPFLISRDQRVSFSLITN